jgi:NADPH:quinone reductase
MTQKALVVPAIGCPLILSDRPIPTPTGSQLLVKVHIAGLNPHDAKAQSLGLFIANILPVPLAADIVGTITALGPDAKKFKKGDKIFSFTNPTKADQAGTQEFALLEEGFSALVPKGLGDHEAATLALNPVTAFWGTFRKQGLGIPPPAGFPGHDPNFDYSSQSIAVVGGGSAVGKYVIAWSKYVGFRTIITTASKNTKSEKELKEWGATHLLDRHLPASEIEAEAREIVGDDLIYVFDAVNFGQAASVGASFLSTTKPGKLVVIAGGDFDASLVPGKKAGFERRMVSIAYSGSGEDLELAKRYWMNLGGLIEKGVLRPTVYEEILGLDVGKVNEAIKGYNEGKHVVKPQLRLE